MADPLPDLASLVAANEAETDHASGAATARRQAVLALRAAGALRTAGDQLAAATVLLHAETVAEVEAAQALALGAMATERRARRLAATAYDRLRFLRGAPQKFGTLSLVRDGRRELWPVDPATTDSERAKWDVPPLGELQRQLTARSSSSSGPA